jgi:hypothetical protein
MDLDLVFFVICAIAWLRKVWALAPISAPLLRP